MRKIFCLFMMLLLAACGGGGGGTTTDTPSTSGKGSLSLEVVQSGTRLAKTLASEPVPANPGRVRVVLNETTTHYRKVVDKAFGETLTQIELPVGTYTVEAILYENGTPNLLTHYGVHADPVVIGTGVNASAALTVQAIDVDVTIPVAPLYSGSGYTVGSPANLAASGLQDNWSLSTSTSAFIGRKHLAQPATATHTGLTAPAVAVGGTLYFQGEFFMKANLLDAGESATNWAFFTADSVALTMPTVPVEITIPTNDTQAPVVKAFNVPSAKQGTQAVPEISILGADNGGIKEYAITTTATAVTGADLVAMPPPESGWGTTPSFTFANAVTFTDQTVYVYAWVKDFAGNMSSQVEGVTNKSIVFNKTPVVTNFLAPLTTVMDGSAIPVVITGKGFPVTGLKYTITETATLPATPVWNDMVVSAATGTATFDGTYQASITQAAGQKYSVPMYAWVKDSADNVSLSVLRTVTVDNSPQITALAATGAATGNTVQITRLVASVFTGRAINGYAVTTTNVKPAVDAFTASAGLPTLPLSYTFTTGITSTNPTTRALYVWLKDDADAISSARGVAVTLKAPSVTP